MPHYGELENGRQDGVITVSMGASPYTFQAARNGLLVLSGGTVSVVELARDGITFTVLGILSGVLPVRRSDWLRITYLSAPTVKLI